MKSYKKLFSLVMFAVVACSMRFVFADIDCDSNSLEAIFFCERSIFEYIFYSFLAGLAVSFTPCIYPMIPITAGVIGSQLSSSHVRNFFLALSYVLGIATVYSVLGYIVALSGDYFGYWLDSPWFVFPLFMFFMYLAGSLFGFYELAMPSILTKRSGSSKGRGSLIYTFMLGAISGTVASPCVSPALIVLLGVVAKSENPLTGIVSLFSFTLGMSALLLLVGTFSSLATKLPRAGMWMIEINRAMGFIILLIAVGFILPFIMDSVEAILYGCILLAASAYYLFSNHTQHVVARTAKRVVGIVLLVVGLAFVLDPYLCRVHNVSLVKVMSSCIARDDE